MSARIDLTAAEVKRADALLVRMREASPPGARLTRMTVLRAVLARGFDALAAEIAAHVKRSPRAARGAR